VAKLLREVKEQTIITSDTDGYADNDSSWWQSARQKTFRLWQEPSSRYSNTIAVNSGAVWRKCAALTLFVLTLTHRLRFQFRLHAWCFVSDQRIT